jgi:hypothetical protein
MSDIVKVSGLNKPNNKEHQTTTNFTKGQEEAYKSLIEFMNNKFDENDFKRALVGPAGTGKTFLVRALIQNCKHSHSTIGVSAPTHKACRVLQESINLSNIKVNTLQSDLGLRLNFNIEDFDINNPPFDPKGHVKIDGYVVYIVDESSMINKGLCTFLEKICKRTHTKLIYLGDASQLPPVKETYSSAFKAIKTSTLTEIVRQGEDNPISPLLELLRKDIKNKTFKFLEHISKNKAEFNSDGSKGYEVLNPKEFDAKAYQLFNDEEFTKNVDLVHIISFTNDCVAAWNNFIRNNIIKDSAKSIITKNDLITSYVTLVNDFNEPIIRNSEEYILHDVVNYVHPKYELKGYMVRFTAIYGGKTTTPLFIVDHNNAFSIQMYCKIANELVAAAKRAPSNYRAKAWKEYFEFKNTCLLLVNIKDGDGKTIRFTRDLDYGFAYTAHKAQGSTFKNVLVDVNDIVFDSFGRVRPNCEFINRLLYVACSRAKDKLYLKYGV